MNPRLTQGCTVMLAMDTYQSCTSWKLRLTREPEAGTAKLTERVAALTTAGTVLPSPWKTAEQVKTARTRRSSMRRLQELGRDGDRARLGGERARSHSARHWQSNVSPAMMTRRDQRGTHEGLPHAREFSGGEILADDGGGREGDGHRRQKQALIQAHADAESRLRVLAEGRMIR